jgi:lipopolysaccharide transport system ATP-binding protein
MSNTVIKVENLSKQYRLGEIGTGSLAHDINRWWYNIRGKEDPYLKIGETNDRTKAGVSQYVWSLKDVNFTIDQGDAVGIIGRNGAGKSTLLKVLSQVTAPTTGSVKVKGRIASLLEVGTGFHPDLSGRDNIFLNGAILGMRKHEIKRKFDEIVDFAGVERYIDTPVKRYSSGMYVRLAFAVAAHLESEILIVDEVLAVGDAEFQKKCLGKMDNVSGEGRTVLFVSHNMGSIASLCKKAILLKTGTVQLDGSIDKVITEYVRTTSTQGKFVAKANKDDQIREAYLINDQEDLTERFAVDEEISMRLIVDVKQRDSLVGIALLDKNKNKIFTSHYEIVNGTSTLEILFTIPSNTITPGNYSFDIALFNKSQRVFDYVDDVCQLVVEETGSSLFYDSNYGSVFINCSWSVLK